VRHSAPPFATPPTPQLRYRSTAKSSKLQRPKICVAGCDVARGVAPRIPTPLLRYRSATPQKKQL